MAATQSGAALYPVGAPSATDEDGAVAATAVSLEAAPESFSFDAAVAVMMQAAGSAEAGDAVRFHASAGLAYPGADVAQVRLQDGQYHATIGLLGLTGPSGVLPRFYTDLANAERRRRSTALAGFFDLLAQRPLAQFAQASVKYRPALIAAASHAAARRDARAPAGGAGEASDGLRHILLSLTGHGAPEMAGRRGGATEALLYYAGLFALRPRSADRLGALLSDWLGASVQVEQFAGHWAALPPESRSGLPAAGKPGRFNQLGTDAAAGARCWDIQSRIVLQIGPLDLPGFQALLPDGALLPRLHALVTRYLDGETGFAVRPVLAAASVPALALPGRTGGAREGGASRLGWNSWLQPGRAREKDAADACFNDEVMA